jgi:hypothetical protein
LFSSFLLFSKLKDSDLEEKQREFAAEKCNSRRLSDGWDDWHAEKNFHNGQLYGQVDTT